MNYQTIPVRLSHLLRHSSVGAILRSSEKPQYFLAIEDTRQWVDKHGYPAGKLIPYVEGVRSALGIDQELRTPPTASKNKQNNTIDGVCIPACRFPSWMHCGKCDGLYFKPWRKKPADEPLVCPKCKHSNIKQAPWVFIHPNGHMADIPWHYIAHQNAKTPDQNNCKHDWNSSYLKLRKSNNGYNLSCMRCSAFNKFDESARIPYGMTSSQPWLRETTETSEDLAVIMSINDSRIHTSESDSALVIPPESRIRRGSVIDRLYCNTKLRDRIARAKNPLAIKRETRKAAEELNCSKSEVVRAVSEIENGYPYYGANPTIDDLLLSEFGALCGIIPNNLEDEDLVTEHYSEQWSTCVTDEMAASTKAVINSISNLVAVTRLKEIQVLRGFSRMGGDLTPPDIIGKSKWLPALEMYGEGLFITIDEEILSRWESSLPIQKRAADFIERFAAADMNFNVEIQVSPRFLLLHTISHLLIRQLEAVAGYPAASLKERIYYSSNRNAPMAGILVYVAVPDSSGSLGGLAEHAKPDKFIRLISSVFEHAEWCSLDPVCSEHEGQGPGLLNKAACHGCALIPEPSCICGNLLLDRTFIKGNLDDFNQEGSDETRIPPFLTFAQQIRK